MTLCPLSLSLSLLQKSRKEVKNFDPDFLSEQPGLTPTKSERIEQIDQVRGEGEERKRERKREVSLYPCNVNLPLPPPPLGAVLQAEFADFSFVNPDFKER